MFVRELYAKPFSVETSLFACKSHLYMSWCRKEWFYFRNFKIQRFARKKHSKIRWRVDTKRHRHMFIHSFRWDGGVPAQRFYLSTVSRVPANFNVWLTDCGLCPWPRFGLYLRNYWAHKVHFFTDGVFLGPIDYIFFTFFKIVVFPELWPLFFFLYIFFAF